MRKVLLVLGIITLLATAGTAQFSFYLIDNFESGRFNESKWWSFGDLKVVAEKNGTVEGRDLIAESCGEYALALSGPSKEWYVGGIGTDLGVDATEFSRFQIDVYGNDDDGGKVLIELFDDDNANFTIEQDSQNNYDPVYDDKWATEVYIQGKGFTRISIPFTAFKDVNPGVGDDKWNPGQVGGSGGLLKLQMVGISGKKSGTVDFKIDNLLLTY